MSRTWVFKKKHLKNMLTKQTNSLLWGCWFPHPLNPTTSTLKTSCRGTNSALLKLKFQNIFDWPLVGSATKRWVHDRCFCWGASKYAATGWWIWHFLATLPPQKKTNTPWFQALKYLHSNNCNMVFSHFLQIVGFKVKSDCLYSKKISPPKIWLKSLKVNM